MRATTMMLIAAAGLSGACSHAPEILITGTGAPLKPASTYRVVAAEGATLGLPMEVSDRLTTQLAAIGHSPATQGKADLLLVPSLDRRPAKLGMFVRGNLGEAGETMHWIEAPRTDAKIATSFALRFVDPFTGRELRSTRATAFHRRRDAAKVLPQLIDGAVMELNAPSPSPYSEKMLP
ncbi:hypothetical protein [Sphingomonas cavernae]|uniref:DUF4136 domain-containing protein n=1 Tax=Sphingomonas cavernae TaxID=2320861 RepID=A0A418WKA1_9SPHN|nr:hypothetical protein [Sphingomonas cavernae]RJF90259.1 hypothetical protein D3876_08245 [Sphingomonas cavernae]